MKPVNEQKLYGRKCIGSILSGLLNKTIPSLLKNENKRSAPAVILIVNVLCFSSNFLIIKKISNAVAATKKIRNRMCPNPYA